MKKSIVVFLIVLVFLFSRGFALNSLPIFADEAIYIRWSQMIKNDPHQYLFLPLYDGKSPLFMWLLIPLLKIQPLDPLIVSRVMSGFFGLFSLYWIVKITQTLKGTQIAQLVAALLVILLPYPLFHDRMGLIDTMLTSLLALSFWLFLKWRDRYEWPFLIGSGLVWGLALMTKTSAFFYAPVLIGIYFYDLWKRPTSRRLSNVVVCIIALVIGISFIGWMKVSPLFPFLIHRSSDFTYTAHDILTQPIQILSLNVPRIVSWFWTYFTPSIWISFFIAFVLNVQKKGKFPLSTVGILLMAMSIFIFPFMMTGKMLASRYLLPAIIWIIPAVALSLDFIRQKNSLAMIGLTGLIALQSMRFALPLLTSVGTTPFTPDDTVQYLTDWSSGYGIPQIRDFLRQNAQNKRILVATEGYFGTLPDGLNVYFADSLLTQNVEIIGIGQPIREVRQEVKDKAPLFDETYIVVNQQRLLMDYHSCCTLIGTYQRPQQGQPLLLLKLNK